MSAPSPDAEALVERRGRAGVIILNRPKALNALNLNMVRLMAAALDEWERDGAVDRIILLGAGERAFCAGGDIRRLYDLGRAGDHDGQLTFWREEYQLDRRIKTYPKPIIALVNGIVMGGGVGLAMNAAHAVASERFVFAMPEVGIGFFPDVGATWFLPRLPYRAGSYFALTGLRADAGDALALGLAKTFVPSASFPALTQALESEEPTETCARPLRRARAPFHFDWRGRSHRSLFLWPRSNDNLGVLARSRDRGTRLRRAGASRDAREITDQSSDRAKADGVGPNDRFRRGFAHGLPHRLAHRPRT